MDERMIPMSELPDGAPYRLLTALVVPRPIAWVSTRSADGIDNLAPHSFFTVASAQPPIVQFTSVGRKDTLRNIEATREFVVNIASRRLLEPVNTSAASVSADVDEYELTGVTKTPSEYVSPPRVSESPAALECRLHDIVPVGDSFVVLGEVLCAWVERAVLVGDRPDEARLDPIARLSGSRYVTYGETITLPRPE